MNHVDVEELHWESPPAAVDLPCPACGGRSGNRRILSVPLKNTSPPQRLAGFRCASCDSLGFDPAEPVSFETFGGEEDLVWRHYLEVGAGPFEMIWPVAVVAPEGRGDLLDVGCGFGFTLAWWRAQGGRAVGLESARYGRMGRDSLGLQIIDGYVPGVPEIEGRRFDVVSASEVIEHVASPVEFVRTLRGYLAPGGVLVLTTPNAGFVTPDAHAPVLLAQISAGYHAYLLSERAFGGILQDAGFAHVRISAQGERLIAWASDRPLPAAVPMVQLRPGYIHLLRSLMDSVPASGPLFNGLAYRALKESVHAGDLGLAQDALQRLQASLASGFGAAILEPERALAAVQSCSTMSELAAKLPFFLPPFFYFRGMLRAALGADATGAARDFQGAFATGIRYGQVAAQLNLETLSLVWPARMQQLMIQLRLGDSAGALRIAGEMARQRGLCTRDFGFARLEPQQADDALRAAIAACQALNAAQPAEALRGFVESSRAIDTAARRHGAAASLPAPMADTAFVIAHYHPRGRVPRYLQALVAHLRSLTPRVVFVSTGLAEPGAEALAPLARVIRRDNFGYDFWSYKVGIDALGERSGIERIVILNSSFLALDPDLLCRRFFAGPDGSAGPQPGGGADLRGILYSRELAPHLQSFWISFEGGAVIRSAAFAAWWGAMLPISAKQHVIERYELGLSNHFARHGFRLEAAWRPDRRESIMALCRAIESGAAQIDAGASGPVTLDPAQADRFNPSHYCWDGLLRDFGIVKLDLLTKNPAHLNTARLRALVESDPAGRELLRDLD